MNTPETESRRLKSKLRFNAREILRFFAAFLVLFGIGYAVAVFLLFPPPAAPQDGIVVPDLTKMTPAAASDRLRPLGLVLGDSLRMPHSSVGPGLIVAQDPLPGQQMRNGGIVRIGVSSGLPAATVPDLTGLAVKRAQMLLERLGFEVNQTVEMSEHPNGTVIRSAPEPGVRRQLPARVLLYVSSGPPQRDTTQTTVDTVSARDTTTTTRN